MKGPRAKVKPRRAENEGIEKRQPGQKENNDKRDKRGSEKKRPNKVSIGSSLPICTSRNMIPIHRAALLNVGSGAVKRSSTLWYIHQTSYYSKE